EGMLDFVSVAVCGIVNGRNHGMHSVQFLAQLDSGAVRQADIKNEKIEINIFREIESLGDTTSGHDAITAVLQECCHHEPRILVIVNVKNASFGVFHIE